MRPPDGELPEMTPLRPRPAGQGLPLPPLVPLVGVICLLAGLALGYGIGPRAPVPSPSPSVDLSEVQVTHPDLSSATPGLAVRPSAGPTATGADLPPNGGLTLTQALAALNKSGMDLTNAHVISARAARSDEVSGGPISGGQDNVWVWVFVLQGSFGIPIIGGYCDPCSTFPTTTIATTEQIVLDYMTGAFLESSMPAVT